MASRLTRLEEELTCPVCHDIFKHPVVLSCSHSFCKDCLQECWRGRPTHDCPVCKTTSSSDHPPTNLVLKNLCENFLEEKLRNASLADSEDLCAAHGEKLRLFCLDDEQLACVVCRDSEKHSGHKFLPVGEASGRYKKKVEELLKPLKEKLEVFDESKTNYNERENPIKVQAQNTEMQIKEQFKKLHEFLQEEEETRISALRVEEAQKSQEMKVTLSDAIQATEDQLRADDHVLFLQNYKTTMERVQLTLQDPQPGALIDEAKHLGNLAYSVWDKMKDIVSYTPVILDPNTAHPGLILSDDLTSVRFGEGQQLPDNPEEIGAWSHGVLGSKGFNSGSLFWDVDVGDNRAWQLGVYEKGEVKACIQFWKGDYSAFHSTWSDDFEHYYEHYYYLLDPDSKPRRIRVLLDWDRGEVSFFDLAFDEHLKTFTHDFTERVFPFFSTGDEIHGMSLKVLPANICVTMEM